MKCVIILHVRLNKSLRRACISDNDRLITQSGTSLLHPLENLLMNGQKRNMALTSEFIYHITF